MNANRREFIKFVVAGSVAAGCPIDLSLLSAQSVTANTASVEGEDNRICHQVRDGKVFTRAPVSSHHDVVIVGGGLCGLTAAYLLRHRDFLLLEKEPHWGGNAYLMDYHGTAYGTGSAFLDKSEASYSLGKEIGLEPLPINNWDGSIIKGEFIPDTWVEGLDKLPYPASVRDGFKKFKQEMLAIDFRKRASELYNLRFSDFMKGYPQELKEWWDNYGRSNWGAESDETAAAMGVQEIRDTIGENRIERFTWPGGLGAITKRLAEILQSEPERMQLGATIVAVVPEKREVQVTYMQGGELKSAAAKAVIMATPKFITRRIVEDLPEQQSQAMQQIHYIPYAVVNLIFDKPVFNKGYDTWCPGNRFTDIVVADWVVRNQSDYRQKYNILTCYVPLREEERGFLLTDSGTRGIAADALRDFQRLFPGSNVDPVEVHVYRRGHPLYKSMPGLYTQVQPLARAPMDRTFFANTDSEGPESTAGTAIAAAHRAVKQAEACLAGAPAAKQTAVLGR
jgi:protoporphyrinogen oxidase